MAITSVSGFRRAEEEAEERAKERRRRARERRAAARAAARARAEEKRSRRNRRRNRPDKSPAADFIDRYQNNREDALKDVVRKATDVLTDNENRRNTRNQRRARRARREYGPPVSFGSSQTAAAIEKKRAEEAARKAVKATRRRARTEERLGPSIGFAFTEAALQKAVGRGDLLSEDEFYSWARKHDVFNPDYQNYVRFVAGRRNIDRDTGAAALTGRARAEAQPEAPQGFRPGRGKIAAADTTFRTKVDTDGGLFAPPGAEGGIFAALGGFLYRDVPEFFGETAPRETKEFVSETFGLFAPGESSQATPGASIAQRAGREASKAAVVDLAGLPVRTATQIAEAFAYTPAFVYHAATDPVGTAKGVADYVKVAAEDPFRFIVERPGDALMIAFGGKGLLSGRATNVAQAVRRGDTRGAVRAAVRPAASTGALTRGIPSVRDTRPVRGFSERVGTTGRVKTRERDLIARIESAEPQALIAIAEKPVIRRKPNEDANANRKDIIRAQSEAIRAVMGQTTAAERAAFFRNQLKTNRSRFDPITRRRLRQVAKANTIVEGLGLLERIPVERLPETIRAQVPAGITDVLWFSGREPALEALGRRAVESSVRGETAKLDLGIIRPEQAALRKDREGAIIRGQDVIPGQRAHLAVPEFPGDEAFRPTAETVRSMGSDLARAEGRLATAEAEAARLAEPTYTKKLTPKERERLELEAANLRYDLRQTGATFDRAALEAELSGRGYTPDEIREGVAWAEEHRDFLADQPEKAGRMLGSKVKRGDSRSRRNVYDPEGRYQSRQHAFAQIVSGAVTRRAPLTPESRARAESRLAEIGAALESGERTVTRRQPRDMTMDEVEARFEQVNDELDPVFEDLYSKAEADRYGSFEGARAEQLRKNALPGTRRTRSTKVSGILNRDVARLLNELRRMKSDDPNILRVQALLRERDELSGALVRKDDPFAPPGAEPKPKMPVRPEDRRILEKAAEVAQRVEDEKAIIAGIRANIAEAEQFLPRPEATAPGLAYGPYKVEDLRVTVSILPERIARRKLGTPQEPSTRRFTGKSLEGGRYGNVVRLTAQEELTTLRYQERLQGWKDAKRASIPARELIRRIDNGETDIGQWAAVRIKPGTSTMATRLLLDWFERVPVSASRSVLDVRSPHGDRNIFGQRRRLDDEDVRLLAREADNAEQIKFFKPSEIGLRTLRGSTRNPVARTAINLVKLTNQLAKTSVLFLAGTAYALPNLVGQHGFSFVHKGVRQPLNDFWQAPRLLNQLDDVTRLKISEIGGTGIIQSIHPTTGPIGALRKFNTAAANFYSRFLDRFWRDGAFVYEAKLRGYETPQQITRLVNEGTTPGTKAHADLVSIKHGIDEGFGAFDRMTDFEKNVLTEAVFFWPWIRASAVYATKLPINHPAKAALLEIGGAYSEREARNDFAAMFFSAGAKRDEAIQYADEIMDMMPGVFLTKNGKFVNAQAAALISSPLEIGKVVGPLAKGRVDETMKNLLNQATPAVSLVGAWFGLNTFTGTPYFSEPLSGRLIDAVSGLNRDVTLAQRLSGDQGKMFQYTPGEAIAQRLAGSFAPRGVNVEGTMDVLRRRIEERGESLFPRPPSDPKAFGLELRQRNQKVRNTVAEDTEKWRRLAAAAGYDAAYIARGEEALKVYGALERAMNTVGSTGQLVETDTGKLSPRSAGLNYGQAAMVVRTFVKKLIPGRAAAVDRAFAEAVEEGKEKEFYQDMRRALSDTYKWGAIRTWIEEQEAANGG